MIPLSAFAYDCQAAVLYSPDQMPCNKYKMQTYVVTCLECGAERRIKVVESIDGPKVDWLESADNANHPIVSARFRLDNQWGFQCVCGNNDLMTTQESRSMINPVRPTPQEIAEIVKNLKPDKPAFRLAVA